MFLSHCPDSLYVFDLRPDRVLQKPVRHPLTRWVRRPGLNFGGLTKLIIIKYSCAISFVNTGKIDPAAAELDTIDAILGFTGF